MIQTVCVFFGGRRRRPVDCGGTTPLSEAAERPTKKMLVLAPPLDTLGAVSRVERRGSKAAS